MRITKELKSKSKTLKTNKGITLIALVITIVVMLILVAVTISMAINGGLFDYAGKAVGDTQNAIDAEQELGSGKIKIGDEWYNSIDEYIKGDSSTDEGTEGGLKIELSIAGEKVTTVSIPTGFKYKEGTIDTGYVIVNETDGNEFVWVPVDKDQKMTLKITSGKDIKSVKLKDPLGDTILTIEDGEIQNTYNNTNIEPTVNGMYFATVETEEETVQETLVVRSLYAIDTWNDWYITEESAEIVSQQYFGTSGNKEEVYTSIATQVMEYESLDVAMETNGCANIDEFITFYWGSNQYKLLEDAVDYTENVNTNGGFYIGRYELGTSIPRENGTSTISVETIISKYGEPVTKEGAYPFDDISFSQALNLSEGMYNNSEFVESLLTCSAWDRTLGWMYETSQGGEGKVREFVGDSSKWGNYLGAEFEITKGFYDEKNAGDVIGDFTKVVGTYTKETDSCVLLTTGTTTRNSKNNIFDLAGNVEEWTNTALISYQATRGGHYGIAVTERISAASLGWGNPGNQNSVYGARAALYLQ